MYFAVIPFLLSKLEPTVATLSAATQVAAKDCETIPNKQTINANIFFIKTPFF